ncbi:hypothetical protein [Paractinoplanes toevensis]|uniref:VWFA domain-containing protein n=1 Tax=Paractinoplanes toevensis TaxID=571911 RepID=A0A919W220_9ACTN|nr:hypothetical protein [Actinoplanes toevensis]GIM89045.1 hypothetical protein Ato02nite_008380 [Actinoplanes toevensis]
MSSRSPTRHRVAAALAALAAALTCAAPAHAAPPPAATVPLPVDGVLSGAGETTAVVDLAALAGADRRAARVEVDGRAVDADLMPVMSEGLSVVLVVDAAAAGAGTLPAWLSAAARFILEAPVGTEAVVVPDRRPAAALTAPQRGPSGVVEALATVRPEGERDTAAALALARGQFPPAAPGRRLVVMYTSAPGAGDEEAGRIAEQFRRDGTLLVVVGTAAAGDYWSAAATATGGFFAPVGEPVVVPALDQVESTLRDRYLVRFPTPAALPARVSITVGTLTAETVLPGPGTADRGRPFIRALLLALALATTVALAILLAARRRRPRPPAGPPGLTSVFTGRATVPGSTRGQPRVPWR